ncbi:hypothetical protein F5884DRAFT_804911 [Xylogone sp. PMI_703]|nr:hypothetical protein F5884DRAFT_804911 [Xylogone sp. PMI_703]
MSGWNKAKTSSKAGFDKVWEWSMKLGPPINKLTNKIGSEAFFPMTIDKESDKAARILKSFCKDGFYAQPDKKGAAAALPPSSASSSSSSAAPVDGPKQKQKVLVKIPQSVIKNCVGLVIYTTMRTGMWISGAGGSGVLIARKPDGSWSPPSGLLIHTLGVGFMAGIDIYDTVLVINDRAALEAFSKLRVSLGGEVSVVAGPLGAGGMAESDLKKARKPVFAYMKSRGLYAGLQVDGTIIVERNDENAAFYGRKVTVPEILSGAVAAPPGTKLLMETLKQAEGRQDLDHGLLQTVANDVAPGDMEIEKTDLRPENYPQAQFAPPPHPPPGSAAEYYAGSQSMGNTTPPERRARFVEDDYEIPPPMPPRPEQSGSSNYPPEKTPLDPPPRYS